MLTTSRPRIAGKQRWVDAQFGADHGFPESNEPFAVGIAKLIAEPGRHWRIKHSAGRAHVPRIAAALLERDSALMNGPHRAAEDEHPVAGE